MKTNKSGRPGATDILMTVVSLLLLIAVRTFIAPCGPAEDGSWMSCHWAGQAITAMAAAMLIISLLHMTVSDPKIKTGLSLALLPVSALTLAIPGILIHLCMMPDMRCRAIMRPASAIFTFLVIIAAVADILVQRKHAE